MALGTMQMREIQAHKKQSGAGVTQGAGPGVGHSLWQAGADLRKVSNRISVPAALQAP